MIEVEKKFILSDDDEKRLTKGAKSLGEKKFTDTYYDTKQYDLAKKDWWLRARDGNFELKVAHQGNYQERQFVDHYNELETEKEIARKLKLPPEENFTENLKTHGYNPFAAYTTTRRKYKKGNFIIDLDDADFGYKVGEIELQVTDKSETPEATRKIIEFAKEHGLKLTRVRGKLLEWIKRNDPEGYQSIRSAWERNGTA